MPTNRGRSLRERQPARPRQPTAQRTFPRKRQAAWIMRGLPFRGPWPGYLPGGGRRGGGTCPSSCGPVRLRRFLRRSRIEQNKQSEQSHTSERHDMPSESVWFLRLRRVLTGGIVTCRRRFRPDMKIRNAWGPARLSAFARCLSSALYACGKITPCPQSQGIRLF